MKIFFVILLPFVLLLNFNIKESSAQRVAGGVGYFLSEIKSQYNVTNYIYDKKMPFSVSFYFTNLYKTRHSFGLRFFHFQRDSKVINPSKENNFYKHGAKNVLSGLLLNHRLIILNINSRMFYVLNNSMGFAVRDIAQKNKIPPSGLPGSFNPVRLIYVPGVELVYKLNDRIAVHATVQYYQIFGSIKEMFPFSSLLSFEVGLSLSEELRKKKK